MCKSRKKAIDSLTEYPIGVLVKKRPTVQQQCGMPKNNISRLRLPSKEIPGNSFNSR